MHLNKVVEIDSGAATPMKMAGVVVTTAAEVSTWDAVVSGAAAWLRSSITSVTTSPQARARKSAEKLQATKGTYIIEDVITPEMSEEQAAKLRAMHIEMQVSLGWSYPAVPDKD